MRIFKIEIWLIIAISLLSSGFLYSQKQTDAEIHILEIKLSNDFIFKTDRYFSNGLELSYYAPSFDRIPTKSILLPDGKNDKSLYAVTLRQDFFTPTELFSTDIIMNDRPFASYLLIGHRKVSLNTKSRLKKISEIQIGLIGKYSGGKSIQNGIHKILPASEPALGWINQIQPDIALNYQIKIEKGLGHNKNFDIIPAIQLRVGVPYTDFTGGFRLLAGKLSDYFTDIGVSKTGGWKLHLFAEPAITFVAYNATLQGGLFSDNIYTVNNLNRWVGTINSGIVLAVKGFTFEFGQHFLTKEFKGGQSHKWGHVSLKFAF